MHVALIALFAAPLLSTEGDLDGRAGAEKITLDSDGTLTAGTATTKVAFDRTQRITAHGGLDVVALGGTRRGVVVFLPTDGDEDPPNRHRVYLYNKGVLKLVFDEVIDVAKLTFSKKGTGRYVESGWAACTREQKPGKSTKTTRKQIVTLTLDKAGKRLIQSRKPSLEIQDCDQLAG